MYFYTNQSVAQAVLLVNTVMSVSASLDVRIGSGSSRKYCFSMSAMSNGERPSKFVLSGEEEHVW